LPIKIAALICIYPPEYVAHLTAKSKYGRMGLSFLNAAKVHKGFIGRLALELVNLSNERRPITIKREDPFMHIEFLTREGEPAPHMGPLPVSRCDGRREKNVYSHIEEGFSKL